LDDDEQLREHVALLLSVVVVGYRDDGEPVVVDIDTMEVQRQEHVALTGDRIAEANEQWPVGVVEAAMSTAECAGDEVHQYDAASYYEGLSVVEGSIGSSRKEGSE
jgi:hypothetical protein